MNPWLVTSIFLLACMIAPFILCARGDPVVRLIGLASGSVMTTMILLLLAVGLHREPFVDLALALSLMSFGAGLLFARFLEHWL